MVLGAWCHHARHETRLHQRPTAASLGQLLAPVITTQPASCLTRPPCCWPQLVLDVVQRGLRPALPANMPDALAQLLEACWQPEADQRPSFQHILLDLMTLRSACGVSGLAGLGGSGTLCTVVPASACCCATSKLHPLHWLHVPCTHTASLNQHAGMLCG